MTADQSINLRNQKRFVEAKKAEGLKRVVLWARPEDVDALKTIARQPHAIAKLCKKVEEELRPAIKRKITAQLERKTRRSMYAQKRAAARQHLASSNSPPDMIRFERIPPEAVRSQLRREGWLYDPVASVWHLPTDPDKWPQVMELLDLVAQYDVTHLAHPPEGLNEPQDV